jgi:hypothetical protein
VLRSVCALIIIIGAARPAFADFPEKAGSLSPPNPWPAPSQPSPSPQGSSSPSPSPEGSPPLSPWAEDQAELRGRVFERGTIVAIPGARIVTHHGRAVTDEEGRFVLRLPPGEHEVLVAADGFEPVRATEKLIAGQGLIVEYRLLVAGRHKYESTVRGAGRHEGQRFTLRDEELHNLPGGLGDPYRVIGALPGVVTPLPVLPYFVIRGATPGMNGYFLDGMRVPQMFHFLLGNGVVHPRLIDRLDFFPGTYDVSFGRYAGGIIDSETRPARPDGHHGEVQLSLFAASALLEFKLPKDVHVEAAGSYGYLDPIIHAIDDRVHVSYWDYQFRLDWKGLTVEALGSYDNLSIARPVTRRGIMVREDDDFRLTFHRVQIRDRERFGRVEVEGALVGGIDQLAYFGGAGVEKLSLNGRFNVRASWNRFKLFAGFDGEVSQFRPSNFDTNLTMQQPDSAGDLGNARDGVVFGAFAQGSVDIIKKRLDATLGARLDVYHAGPVTLLGIDPRLLVNATLLPWLKLHGGIGYYHQPPAFPIPLPGIDTFSLQLGLQRAIQGSMGVTAELPQSFSFTLTGYYSQFYNINDAAVDFGPAVCTSPPPESLTGLPSQLLRQVDGDAYGMELLLRRSAGRFTGWIAYTLSRSERVYSCGLRPSDYDQSHVLNIVVQARLPWKLMVGARLLVTTGRPVTILEPPDGRSTVRNNVRLPNYVQLDLRIDREWIFKSWALAAFLEALNLTYSESIFGITYPDNDGVKDYFSPQYNGFHWILPTVGLRGRY